jgi:distal antenna
MSPKDEAAVEEPSDDEDDEPPLTAADAVAHGEKFLRWLDCCSDPSITALQILQFRYLLNNVRACAARRAKVSK